MITQIQTEQTCTRLLQILPEFTDSSLLLGETVDGDPIALLSVQSREQADRINQMIFKLAADGGIKFDELLSQIEA